MNKQVGQSPDEIAVQEWFVCRAALSSCFSASITDAKRDVMPARKNSAAMMIQKRLALHSGLFSRARAFILVAGGPAVVLLTILQIPSRGAEPLGAVRPPLDLSENGGAKIDISPRREHGFKIVIRGERYNGQRLIRALAAAFPVSDDNRWTQDVDIDIDVQRLFGFNGEILRDAQIRFSTVQGVLHDFVLDGKLLATRNGRLRDDSAVQGRIDKTAADLPSLRVTASDAGAFFRFFDIYDRLVGGSLQISLQLDGVLGSGTSRHDTQRGELELEHFAVNEPGLANMERLFGLFRARPHFRLPGYLFLSQLRLEFSRSPNEVAVKQGVTCNAAFAAVVTGRVSPAMRTLEFAGRIWDSDASDQTTIFPPPTKRDPEILEPPATSDSPLEVRSPLDFVVSGSLDTPKWRILPFQNERLWHGHWPGLCNW